MLYCSPIGGVKGNIEAGWGRPSTACKCLFEKNENFQEKSFFPPVTRRARSPPPHILTLPLLQPLCKIWSSLRMSGSPTHIQKQVRLGTWLGLMMTTMMAMRILMILTTVKSSRHTLNQNDIVSPGEPIFNPSVISYDAFLFLRKWLSSNSWIIILEDWRWGGAPCCWAQ